LGHFDGASTDGRPELTCPGWDYTLTVWADHDLTKQPIGAQTIAGDGTSSVVQFEIDVHYPVGVAPGTSVCVIGTNGRHGNPVPEEIAPESGCFAVEVGEPPSSNFH